MTKGGVVVMTGGSELPPLFSWGCGVASSPDFVVAQFIGQLHWRKLKNQKAKMKRAVSGQRSAND
jgi:hypothetical protein